MRESKAITTEEARYLFMRHMVALINYWDKESRATSSRDKLEGLMHSVLVTLDGGAAGLPGYQVIPLGKSEGDIKYAKDNGFDYYPEEPEDIIEGTMLHGILFPHIRNEIPRPENLYDFSSFLAEEAKQWLKK